MLIDVCALFIQGKSLPAYLSADAEEGEVSDDDSADEIEDDFKLKSSNVRRRIIAVNMKCTLHFCTNALK